MAALKSHLNLSQSHFNDQGMFPTTSNNPLIPLKLHHVFLFESIFNWRAIPSVTFTFLLIYFSAQMSQSLFQTYFYNKSTFNWGRQIVKSCFFPLSNNPDWSLQRRLQTQNQELKGSVDRFLPAALGDGFINSFVYLLVVVVLVSGVLPHVGFE